MTKIWNVNLIISGEPCFPQKNFQGNRYILPLFYSNLFCFLSRHYNTTLLFQKIKTKIIMLFDINKCYIVICIIIYYLPDFFTYPYTMEICEHSKKLIYQPNIKSQVKYSRYQGTLATWYITPVTFSVWLLLSSGIKN